MAEKEAKHHVVLFPLPGQGHIGSMLKLAQLLSTAGFYITFVHTERNYRRFLLTSTSFNVPKFRFRTIPDGFPDNDPRSPLPFIELQESLDTKCKGYYREVLVAVDEEWPPVTCVVADTALPLALEVPEELGIPVMILAPHSAGSILTGYSIPQLIQGGEFPFPEDADMDELLQGVLGLEGIVRRRDMSVRGFKSIDSPFVRFEVKMNQNLSRGRALILNTTESMDSLALRHIRSICPTTYTLGPFHVLLRNIKDQSHSASLSEEDRSCIAWLDTKPNKSVVYVSFGSLAAMSREAFLEFQQGLLDSGYHFLWVIRPDMVEGGLEECELTASERRYFVKWAPQEEVLAHPAVGCFLTHSGWNSTLESIYAGVPMICWPFFADQLINSRFVSEVWKIALDMKDLCGRSYVERMVKEVMSGEKGKELRKSICEMADMVKKSAEEGGSSYTNFKELIGHIKSLSLPACSSTSGF
uniref:Myricetin 3-O-rhamnoside 1,2-glucosyltransferase UGT709G2 n=1 Tax=Crocosmia x crocosmiiflora TaxID=1053288 RepID=U70G2_CROXC|nr:RecName: Full=Myricetin 3-O-rhamnoside 1,2-glucosyltransferase UGT709G2; AltName: Full=UDP-glucosyltransferase 2; Short=CcUGT2 [Crocosmia x crocosmiiflora]AXB26716.1 myricetin-3O-rhamnoside 1,2-glucosyltransferase [Crocosmia x crocosmiiflora]